jgi:hypothetical protein
MKQYSYFFWPWEILIVQMTILNKLLIFYKNKAAEFHFGMKEKSFKFDTGIKRIYWFAAVL